MSHVTCLYVVRFLRVAWLFSLAGLSFPLRCWQHAWCSVCRPPPVERSKLRFAKNMKYAVLQDSKGDLALRVFDLSNSFIMSITWAQPIKNMDFRISSF